MKIIVSSIRYLFRVVFSAPLIGAGILDGVILVLFALGLKIEIPVWVYGLFLGIGAIIENIRIYFELQELKEKITTIIVKVDLFPVIQEQKDLSEDRWASIEITNRDDLDLTDCYVDLENIVFVPIESDQTQYIKIQPGRLAWSQSSLASNEGKISIERGNHKVLDVARTKNGFLAFTLRRGDDGEGYLRSGFYKIEVIFGGKRNNLSFIPIRRQYKIEYQGYNKISIVSE